MEWYNDHSVSSLYLKLHTWAIRSKPGDQAMAGQ
jgi:hypothetical protein